jgi:chemotaxis protein methyltransferase CheR
MGQDITLDELEALNNAILARHGIDFTNYEPKSFSRRVSRAIDYFGFENLMEMWTKLLQDRKFLFDFIDQITVGMTSLFRDPQMWKFLKNDILLNYKQENKKIDIWHAGCSTGEETYSLGVLLQELKIQSRVRAVATDLNRESIEKSKSGVYDKLTLRQNEVQFSEYTPFKKLEEYYSEESPKEFKMNTDLVSHCNYKVSNMISDEPPFPGRFDVIFCRNVLIYFDTQLKEEMLNKFYNALKPDGFLVVGYFDALLPVINKDHWHFYNLGAKIFQKQ